jgi:hypothetical protein
MAELTAEPNSTGGENKNKKPYKSNNFVQYRPSVKKIVK